MTAAVVAAGILFTNPVIVFFASCFETIHLIVLWLRFWFWFIVYAQTIIKPFGEQIEITLFALNK